MEKNALITRPGSVSIKDRLAVLCNTRPKTFRTKDIFYDKLRKDISALDSTLQNDHNCKALALTITLPQQTELELQWRLVGPFVDRFKRCVANYYLIVGGIIALEPHRNSSLTTPKGKNTRAGRPHLHMILWITHEFLNPAINQLDFALEEGGLNARVKPLKAPIDIVKAGLYALKERENFDLRGVCQEYLGWSHNVNIWVNHNGCETPFLLLKQRIKSCFLTKEMYLNCPTTRRCPTDELQVAELFAQLFLQKGLAVKRQMVYSRRPGTRYAWTCFMPLSQWIENEFHFNLPLKSLEKLKQCANFILTRASQNKQGPYFQLFPKLCFYKFYVEYKDCVYDFGLASTRPFEQVAANAATACSRPHAWDETPAPWRFLGLIYTLISLGVDSRESYLEALKKVNHSGGVEKMKSGDMGSDEERKLFLGVERPNKNFAKLVDTLASFGGRYHPVFAPQENFVLSPDRASKTGHAFLLEILFKRLKPVKLHRLVKSGSDETTSRFWERISEQALGFSILANAVFLYKSPHYRHKIVLPQSFCRGEIPGQAETLEKTGFSLMQSILETLEVDKVYSK